MQRRVSSITGSRQDLYINGQWVVPKSGKYSDSFSPATGQPWYEFAEAGEQDVDHAVLAAAEAFRTWSRTSPADRGALLFKLGMLIAENSEDLARIELQDNGKILRETRGQMRSLASVYRYYAGMVDKIEGHTYPMQAREVLCFSQREPLGVVGVITPWNSPLHLLAATLAPCLAVGNSVVVKPSEHTSVSSLAFAELIEEAGFPAGVVNVVTGLGFPAGDALTKHPLLAKVSFTGGTDTGRKVASNAGSALIPSVLELGGKSPNVVFDDVDIERAVKGVIGGIFAAGGQTCVAGSRCFVHANIYDQFLECFAEHASRIVVGDPMQDDTQMGPLALKDQLRKVSQYVEYGRQAGAKLIFGGKPPADTLDDGGWFFEPTIFSDVRNDMRIARDEIFGPVSCVLKFTNERELLAEANDTVYGLAAGIWTRDIDRALRFAREIDAGRVWINTYRKSAVTVPSGGFKQSGYGKHSGFEAISEFSRLKTVMIDYSEGF